jgi:hypothetical protein
VKERNRKARTMVKESLRDDNESMRINFGKCVIKVFPGRKFVNFSKCIIKVFTVVWRKQYSRSVETFPKKNTNFLRFY